MRNSSGRETRAAVIFLGPLFLFLGLLIFLPVAGTIITSLYRDISFVDKEFVLFDNYRHLFTEKQFGAFLTNSIVVTTASVLLALAAGTFGAYAIARFRLKFNLDRYVGLSLKQS